MIAPPNPKVSRAVPKLRDLSPLSILFSFFSSSAFAFAPRSPVHAPVVNLPFPLSLLRRKTRPLSVTLHGFAVSLVTIRPFLSPSQCIFLTIRVIDNDQRILQAPEQSLDDSTIYSRLSRRNSLSPFDFVRHSLSLCDLLQRTALKSFETRVDPFVIDRGKAAPNLLCIPNRSLRPA